jgi:molybdate transport system substrate-binding protein
MKLKLISSMATRKILSQVCEAFGQQYKIEVELTAVGGVDALKLIEAGETFDVVVLAMAPIEQLITQGLVAPDSKTPVAHSGIAVCVQAGAVLPNITSSEHLRATVNKAATIGYSTGPSGVYLQKLFAQWDAQYGSDISTRLRQAPPGVPVASLVARGDLALGFQQLSELIDVSGIHIVGPMPSALQLVTTFTAGALVKNQTNLSAVDRERIAAARQLLEFLASSASAHHIRRCGMEPATA